MSDEDAKSALHALREYDELGWTTRDGIADVIESQQREIEELREWNAAMVEKMASGGTLDGYREMASKVASLQSRLDECEAALRQHDALLSTAANVSGDVGAYSTGWKDCVAWIRQRLTREGE